MNEKTKESKFLDAINKYALHQQEQITQEIEDYKNAKIEQATEQGLQDAYDMIRDHIASRKAAIVNDVAKQELSSKNDLYRERQSICENIFRQAREKLKEFTQSEEYTQFLERSAKEIAQHCGNDKVVVYVAPFDESRSGRLQQLLPDAEVKADSHILLGGLRAHCPTKGVMLDDTLDTRLSDQYAWFYENSGLKVI